MTIERNPKLFAMTLRLDPELHKRAVVRAKEKRRSLANLIRELLAKECRKPRRPEPS